MVDIKFQRDPKKLSKNKKNRHCEVRSNPQIAERTYQADLQAGDCFVPRNDVMVYINIYKSNLNSF